MRVPTRELLRVAVAALAVGSAGLLGASAWPGLLESLLLAGFVLLCASLPCAAGAVLGAVILDRRLRRLRWSDLEFEPLPGGGARLLVAIPALSVVLLAADVPARVAFRVSRHDFEERLALAAPSPYPEGQRLGLYEVADLWVDAEGNGTFVVRAPLDLRSDAGGFVHVAGETRARPEWLPLGGGWYRFEPRGLFATGGPD